MNNLRKYRKAAGLTQKQLGEKIGLDASTISRLENEHHSAQLENYRDAADCLEISLAQIFLDDQSPEAEILAMSEQIGQETVLQLLAAITKPRSTPP